MAYRSRWASGPQTALPPSTDNALPMYYSQDVGNIHFVNLDSEESFLGGSRQYQWAAADLAAAFEARASGTGPAWTVVTNHRPLVSTDNSELDDHTPMSPKIQALQPLLIKYGVQLAVMGHQHSYERVHPQVNGTVVTLPSGNPLLHQPVVYTNVAAPVIMTIGTAGAVQAESWLKPHPEYSAFRMADTEQSYGYVQVTAHNDTHLQWDFRPIKSGGRVDEFWIVQS